MLNKTQSQSQQNRTKQADKLSNYLWHKKEVVNDLF